MFKLTPRFIAIVAASLVLMGVVGVGVHAAYVTPRSTLRVVRTTFCDQKLEVCDQPDGHVLLFSGWFDMRLLVTHKDALLNNKLMPLIQGKDVGRAGYYHAGTQDDLVFVRKGSTLQVQRELRDEMSATPGTREPIFTMYLPTTIKVEVVK